MGLPATQREDHAKHVTIEVNKVETWPNLIAITLQEKEGCSDSTARPGRWWESREAAGERKRAIQRS